MQALAGGVDLRSGRFRAIWMAVTVIGTLLVVLGTKELRFIRRGARRA